MNYSVRETDFAAEDINIVKQQLGLIEQQVRGLREDLIKLSEVLEICSLKIKIFAADLGAENESN